MPLDAYAEENKNIFVPVEAKPACQAKPLQIEEETKEPQQKMAPLVREGDMGAKLVS